MKVKLYYLDTDANIYLGEVITNKSMTVKEILGLLGTDMNKVAEEQGWDGWDFNALTTETE